jgi:PAS domain S-box-containing protein
MASSEAHPSGSEELDEAAHPRDRPPAYDPSKKEYASISTGALSDAGDVSTARDLAEMIVDTVREGLLVLDLDLRVKIANESFYQTFEVTPEETVGRCVYELGNGQWDLPELRRRLEEVLPHDDAFNDYEVDHDFEGIGRRVMLLNARRLNNHQLILLAVEDVTKRRAGEELRRERDERLRRLADTVPALLWATDPAGRCFFLNQAWYDFTGQTEKQALGFGWLNATHPDDRDRARDVFLAANERGEPFQLDYRLRRRDGAYRWAHDLGHPRVTGEGTFLGYIGSVIDIDDRKRAEQALRESQRTAQARLDELEATYATAPIGLCVLDTDLRFVRINERLAEINGLPVEAHLGRAIHDVVPAVADEIEPMLRRIIETGEPALDVEVSGETAAQPGVERTWVENWFPLFDSDGRVIGINVVAEEITERKRTEVALRASEERYRTLFESMDEGFCVFEMLLDAEGEPTDYRFLEANPAFERHTGLVDAVGKTARALVPGLEDYWVETYGRVAQTGEPERFIQESPAMGQWFEVEAFRVGGAGSQRVGLLFTDITERKEAEAALRQMNETLEARVEARTRQVRELSRALTLAEQQERQRIAHILHDDLQQLLFAAQLADSLDEADQLRTVLDDAMALTRTLSHELSPPLLQEEDLEDLLRWLADRQYERYGLDVEVETRGEVPVPDADLRVLLYQLLRELLFNVVKHAETKRARLTAERVGGHVRVCVEDQGHGFELEDADQLRAPGLGLPSVRERLELVGGVLEVESTVGEGTRVTITVPVADSSQA